MNFKGLNINIKNKPELDCGFIPMAAFVKEYLNTARLPLAIAVERNGGLVSVYETFWHGTEDMAEADKYYVGRLIKTLLWFRGGYKVTVCGANEELLVYLQDRFSKTGSRAFDNNFLSKVFEKEFVLLGCKYEDKPVQNEASKPIGRNLEGCRIGFDAGGSDRKVSAVIDGEAVFSEEVVWFPKVNSDPDYHFNGIVEALKTAASKMPKVDAIGVSSAGIYIDNRTMMASLFLKVPSELYESKVKDIYIRAAKEIGNVPLEVVNDGDVTALAGAMSLNDTNVLGIAMGTSEAGGYVDKAGNITGWLNELAFAPVDANPKAMRDEWSGDIGCGVKYFSQDGVIKLALMGGIDLDESLSPGENLKVVQGLLSDGNETAKKVFESIGVYLGHTVAYYDMFYDIKHILLLGRVMSGEGGNLILANAKRVLNEEYPELCEKISLELPDEKSRRVGQSVAAASLPKI